MATPTLMRVAQAIIIYNHLLFLCQKAEKSDLYDLKINKIRRAALNSIYIPEKISIFALKTNKSPI